MRHVVAFLFALLFCVVGLALIMPMKFCGVGGGPMIISLGAACLVLSFAIALPTNAREAFAILRDVLAFWKQNGPTPPPAP